MKERGHDMNDIRLVLGAIPLLNLNQSEESNAGDANLMNAMRPTSNFNAANECQNQQKCDECILKDLLIKQYESEIESLRNVQNQLQKLRKSTYYLKTSKSNLKETLNEEKHKNLIDLKLLKELEVGFQSHIIAINLINFRL